MRDGECAECDGCGARIEAWDTDLGDHDWIYIGVKHDSQYNDHKCPRCHEVERQQSQQISTSGMVTSLDEAIILLNEMSANTKNMMAMYSELMDISMDVQRKNHKRMTIALVPNLVAMGGFTSNILLYLMGVDTAIWQFFALRILWFALIGLSFILTMRVKKKFKEDIKQYDRFNEKYGLGLDDVEELIK